MAWQVFTAVLLFTFAASVRVKDCLFDHTYGAVDSAAEFAVSAGDDVEGNSTLVKYAPATIRVFPEELLEDRDAEFFNSLLRRRHNSRGYLWASLEGSERKATAMAHIINCAAERFARTSARHRHSLCISKVAGNQASDDTEERCDTNLTSLILIGKSADNSRMDRIGTKACWCEEACIRLNAVFSNKTEPAKEQLVTSYAVLEAGGEAKIVSDFEEENDGINGKWFEENILEDNTPHGKGLFPRGSWSSQARTGGTILRSLQVINILQPVSSELRCPSDPQPPLEDRLDRRTVARVQEELGKALEQGISVPLPKERARRSEIVLVVSSSLVAALAFDQKDLVFKLIPRIRASSTRSRRLLTLTALVLVLIFEIVVELFPIYFLLQEEVSARDLVKIRGFEVIGMGSVKDVIPLSEEPSMESREEFTEASSGLVIMALKNRGTRVPIIAALAAFLTCVSVGTIAGNIVRGIRRKETVELEKDESFPDLEMAEAPTPKVDGKDH